MTKKILVFLLAALLVSLLTIFNAAVNFDIEHATSPCWYLLNADSIIDDDDSVVSCMGYKKGTFKYSIIKFYIQIKE